MTLKEKELRLLELLGRYRSALVAFSGGVDSSYLAFVANRVMGSSARIVTALSPSVSRKQEELARRFARDFDLNHIIINTLEVEDPHYLANPSNRCYFCKSELFSQLALLKRDWGVDVILDGSNADDLNDYRPGRQAAAESEIESPLAEAGLTKEEIRELSREAGLATWDLPAMPCLASRFPYGVEITPEKLRQVELAEAFLRDLGFRNFRVRHHDELARIEIAGDEMSRILSIERFSQINGRLKELGYRFVALDLEGFRSGSLNELLQIQG